MLQLLNLSISQLHTHCPFCLVYFFTFTSKFLHILQVSAYMALPDGPYLTSICYLFPLLCAPIGLCTFSFISLIMHYCNYSFHCLSSPVDHKLHEGRSHVHLVHNYISSSITEPECISYSISNYVREQGQSVIIKHHPNRTCAINEQLIKWENTANAKITKSSHC